MSGAAGQVLLDALMIQAGRSCRRASRVVAHGLGVRAVDSQVRR